MTIELEEAIRAARNLCQPPGSNLEYERGICELLGWLTATPTEYATDAARRMAEAIGLADPYREQVDV